MLPGSDRLAREARPSRPRCWSRSGRWGPCEGAPRAALGARRQLPSVRRARLAGAHGRRSARQSGRPPVRTLAGRRAPPARGPPRVTPDADRRALDRVLTDRLSTHRCARPRVRPPASLRRLRRGPHLVREPAARAEVDMAGWGRSWRRRGWRRTGRQPRAPVLGGAPRLRAPGSVSGLPDLSRLAEAVIPAVVGVVTTQAPPPGARTRAPRPVREAERGPRRGIGSGFVIHRDGWVVTNAHVVEGAEVGRGGLCADEPRVRCRDRGRRRGVGRRAAQDRCDRPLGSCRSATRTACSSRSGCSSSAAPSGSITP